MLFELFELLRGAIEMAKLYRVRRMDVGVEELDTACCGEICSS